MQHHCIFQKTDAVLPFDKKDSFCKKLKVKLQRLIVISDENPFSLLYFRSNRYIREEGMRQMRTNRHTIHPFSKFRQWYDFYQICLYLSLLFTKPVEACFMTKLRYDRLPGFFQYNMITDILTWIDIVICCFTGHYVEVSSTVELRLSVIAKGYLTSWYCVCDLISSIPKALFSHLVYNFWHTQGNILLGFVSIACLFKLPRVVSLMISINRLTVYVSHGHRKRMASVCNVVILLLAIHWLACLQFGISMIFRVYFFPSEANRTWIARAGLLNATTMTQYFNSFFKINAYILGIQVSSIYHKELPEEYLISAITYIIGKILVIYGWVIMAVYILNSKSTNIKFGELINQLKEYMTRKRLPLKLRNRIMLYYDYKYQKKYVKEKSVSDLLSNNLKQEINLHHCRSIIQNVSLFAELNQAEVIKIVERLVVEIFLPNDSIYTSGSLGTDLYFIASGTVAMYSRSGKEVCHLEEGAYFGEVCLIIPGQIRINTVVAIEMCQLYRLSKKDFYICLANNKELLEKMMIGAQKQIKAMKMAEDEYWKSLFEQTFQNEPKKE